MYGIPISNVLKFSNQFLSLLMIFLMDKGILLKVKLCPIMKVNKEMMREVFQVMPKIHLDNVLASLYY